MTEIYIYLGFRKHFDSRKFSLRSFLDWTLALNEAFIYQRTNDRHFFCFIFFGRNTIFCDCSKLPLERFTCACHWINIILKAIFKSKYVKDNFGDAALEHIKPVYEILDQSKKLVEYFKRTALMKKLKKTIKQELFKWFLSGACTTKHYFLIRFSICFIHWFHHFFIGSVFKSGHEFLGFNCCLVNSFLGNLSFLVNWSQTALKS